MSQFGPGQMQPGSQHVLWSGSPSDLTAAASGGRIVRAAYTVTTDAIQFEAGVVTTRAETIPLWAVIDVDLTQTVTQKARGVADLALRIDPRAAAQYGQHRLVLRSIKEARMVKDLIIRQANAIRVNWTNHQHERSLEHQRAGATQFANVVHTQSPAPQATAAPAQVQPAAPPQAQIAPAAGGDLMSRLKELAELKTAGLFTADEFTAAKALLLAGK